MDERMMRDVEEPSRPSPPLDSSRDSVIRASRAKVAASRTLKDPLGATGGTGGDRSVPCGSRPVESSCDAIA